MKDLRHDNVNTFVGAVTDGGPQLVIVTEYCSKGSLQDIIENDDVKLDSMFIASLVMDLIKGLLFLHDSELHTHGNLKSSNCVVNSRWTLQVTDYGLLGLRRGAWGRDDDDDETGGGGGGEHATYRNLLWTAPELLRDPSPPPRGTQKADVYAFGIILYELINRSGPYGSSHLSPKEIVERVKNGMSWTDKDPAAASHIQLTRLCDGDTTVSDHSTWSGGCEKPPLPGGAGDTTVTFALPPGGEEEEAGSGGEPFRPDVSTIQCESYMLQLIEDCWEEIPEARPDLRQIRSRLKPMRQGILLLHDRWGHGVTRKALTL